MENNNRDYPTKISGVHDIKEMSNSFIKTQIECIKHTDRNKEYLELLEKEYKKRTIIKFKLAL